jgi:hypothetical protein
MFDLQSILWLGSAALRRLREPQVRPSYRRLSLECLSDRVLPSVDFVGPVHLDSVDWADPEVQQMRFMEVPKSGPVLQYWESGTFTLTAKEMFDILGGLSHAEQLGPPVVTRGTVDINGQAFPTLELGFGSSLAASFVFAGKGAGSAGNAESATYDRPSILGGLLEVSADGGERRFLMDYRGSERAGPGAPFLLGVLTAESNGDNKATQPGPGDRPAVEVPEPVEALCLSGMTGPCLASFMAGWPGGTQIAGTLSTPSADDAGANGMAEVDVHAPGNPADVLLTVDTVLPDAKADLVRLQNADLAIVPTYVVAAAPANSVARPRGDDQPDLGLAAHVVGLDAFPGDGTTAAPDRVFEQLAWAESGPGVDSCSLHLATMQLAAIDVGDPAPDAAQAEQSGVPADAAPTFREWLDGVLDQREKAAVMVPVLALEGVMAFIYWRGLRPDRQNDRPKSPQKPPTCG